MEARPFTTQAPPQNFLLVKLGNLDGISDQKSLVLTKKQRLARQQERSFQTKDLELSAKREDRFSRATKMKSEFYSATTSTEEKKREQGRAA